ncbi:mucin-5AC isoform X1 [Drosophila mauritiana]|uniref:Mucin-5AC isoform X1 n=1 Tax=Drosophila mauritiana TaxID=7226 RepID=A0A6P8JMD9_DROMA|nr:mucin-5AC isoform X1 [Drosophila mauritiana]
MQFDPKPRCGGSVVSFTVMLLLITGADFAAGRPDVRESPFALNLQPPLLQSDVTFSSGQGGGAGPKAIDSYGNPIDALRPIDTPDGRKVVSAQGVQFEIPTYASGITEIRRPADDLLPPHIGELTSTRAAAASGATSRTETEMRTRTLHETKTKTENNASTAPHTTSSRRNSINSTSTRTALAAPISTTNKLAKRESLGVQFPIAPPSNRHAPPPFSLIKLNPFAALDSPITQIGTHSSPSPLPSLCPSPKHSPIASSLATATVPTNANCSKYSIPNPLQSDAIAVGLEPSTDQKPNPNSFTGTASASAPAPLPATSLTPPLHDPISPDTTTTADVEVEQAHLVPLPQEEKEVESLPDYIRELQREDANIGGPVEWKPAADGAPLSVIAWDLLPPHRNQDNKDQAQEPTIITEAQQQPAKKVQGIVDPISHNIRISLSSGNALSPVAPTEQLQAQPQDNLHNDGPADHGTNAHVGTTTPSNPGRFPNRQRGTAHYSTTRSSSTTLRPRISTTTTKATTTTARTTTTTPRTTTTTPRTTTTTRGTTTTTTTTAKPETRTANPVASTIGTTEDPSTFYRLENEEAYAYTLPTWLQEVTDPDLDVAVTFEVPTDNDQYNHTLANDLEPPFEPFVDLGNIQLTPPPTDRPTTTSTTTTTTTTTTPAPTTTTTTTTTTPRTTTTTTTRRPSTQRTTKAPIPPTHSTQEHPEPPPVKLTTITTHHADNTPEDSSSSGSSSTTTFVNTTPIPLDAGNPFDSATIPAWLRDFDYPDVGPGVPFDPDNFGTASASSTRNPTNPPRPPTVPPVSSAFPSKVTLPLPGSSISSSSSSSEEPQLVLVPPADRSEAASGSDSHFGPNPGQLTHPTSNSVTPFAARFEPSASSSSSQSVEPFPPSKVEYTKSDEGKVISTPVTNNQRKTETVAPPASNTGKYTGGFGAPPGLLRPQSTNPSGSNSNPRPGSDIYVAGNQHEFSSVLKANKARPTVNPGRYNGGFGAPTGVLSPQSQAEPRPFQPINQRTEHREQSSGGNRRTESRFGGPPGILVPFDNVQRTGGQ